MTNLNGTHSWTPPETISLVKFELYGGGASGYYGEGGSGGAYCMVILNVTYPQTFNYTIGVAGVPVNSTLAQGGATILSSGSLTVAAEGGVVSTTGSPGARPPVAQPIGNCLIGLPGQASRVLSATWGDGGDAPGPHGGKGGPGQGFYSGVAYGVCSPGSIYGGGGGSGNGSSLSNSCPGAWGALIISY